MRTNDVDTSGSPRDGYPNPSERWMPLDADWASWIDPNDAHVSETRPRSTSEQPRTGNARLRTRAMGLSPNDDDMIESAGVAAVFLDRRLRVVRFTPAAREIGYDRMVEVVEVARSVLDTLRPRQSVIQATSGRRYRMHVDPHRTLDNAIAGVVISFIDITERRRAE